jgi:hypothetical protein
VLADVIWLKIYEEGEKMDRKRVKGRKLKAKENAYEKGTNRFLKRKK